MFVLKLIHRKLGLSRKIVWYHVMPIIDKKPDYVAKLAAKEVLEAIEGGKGLDNASTFVYLICSGCSFDG